MNIETVKQQIALNGVAIVAAPCSAQPKANVTAVTDTHVIGMHAGWAFKVKYNNTSFSVGSGSSKIGYYFKRVEIK